MPALPDLEDALLDIETRVHERDDSRAREWIVLLKNPYDPYLQWAAAWALGRLAVQEAVPALHRLALRDFDKGREAAAQALFRIGPDEERARLMERLVESTTPIEYAFGGHGRLYPELVRWVRPYCDSQDVRIRIVARRFVAKHSGSKVDAGPPEQNNSADVDRWLHEVAAGDTPKAEESACRLQQCESLPRDASRVLTPALSRARKHPFHDSRSYLTVALARTGDPAAAGAIAERLGEREVVAAAVQGLQILLERAAAGIDEVYLRGLAAFPDEKLHCWDQFISDWGRVQGIGVVDLVPMKKLAAAEWARRQSNGRELS